MELSSSTAPSLLRRIRRRVLVHRRGLAAALAAIAVLSVVRATTTPPPPTRSAWTAARDLPGGERLGAGDLRRVRFAAGTTPAGAIGSSAEVTGRTLAAPVRRGEVFTAQKVIGPGLLAGYPGRTAVPARITDPLVVALLRVGDRVTLVAADPDGRRPPVTLAEDVPVVAIPRANGSWSSSDLPGRLVLIAVPDSEAASVAATAVASLLIVTWRR